MSKDTDKTPATEPTGVTATEGPDIEALLRLSKDATSRRGTREADRMARLARTRGWTRDELYERGSPKAD